MRFTSGSKKLGPNVVAVNRPVGHPKDRHYTYDDDGKCLNHRPPAKLVVNPVLRRAQFWMKHPWVIASITDIDDDGKAHFGGYVFKRQGLK